MYSLWTCKYTSWDPYAHPMILIYHRLLEGCECPLLIKLCLASTFSLHACVSDSLARHHSSTHVDPTTMLVSAKPIERHRVSRACKRCSTSKIRCSGQLPCEKCSQSNSRCFYEKPKKRKSGRQSDSEHPAKQRAQSQTVSPNEAGMGEFSEGQQSPADQSDPMALAQSSAANVQAHSLAVPSPGKPISHLNPEAINLTGSSEMNPYNGTFGPFDAPNVLGFQNDLDDSGWITGGFDSYLWPMSFDLSQEFDFLQDSSGSNANATPRQISGTNVPQIPSSLPPIPAPDIADLYSRSHSPVLDKDAVEVRQYHPTSIEIDAPLHFPDIDPASVTDANLEDFSHVNALSSGCVDAIVQLAEDIQRNPHHPPFTNLKLPPQPILNAWVQLYFEYFHPIFPILHKPTFSSPETPPLLILAVAGIGAQFSNLSNASAFAQGIRELVRRQSSSLVSTALADFHSPM